MRLLRGARPPHRSKLGPTSAAALALLLVAPLGCTQRKILTKDELNRVSDEADIVGLRVYPERRTVVVYDEKLNNQRYDVRGTIQQSSDRKQIKRILKRDTAGLIVALDKRNGKRLLWVTFSPRCSEPECSFGFVEVENGHYRLMSIPDRPVQATDDLQLEKPRVYRGTVRKKRKMKPGKVASLAEANEVLLVKKRRGKVLTLDLVVKKKERDRTQKVIIKDEGIE